MTEDTLVFVVDYDADSAQLVCDCLDEAGYMTRYFGEATSVIREALRTPPSLFLLDINLPGGNGFDLCRRIRQTKWLESSAVVFLTADPSERNRVRAFESGGDDYIAKPFNPRELVARVRTVLRSSDPPVEAAVSRFGPIEINGLSMTVRVNGKDIGMTVREFRVLEYIAEHAPRCLSREQILEGVWPSQTHVSLRSVDVFISRLRRKIEVDPDHPVYLKTVRGGGYRFEENRTSFRPAKSNAA